MVIFTTAYKDYAAEAFDTNAVDYITKPVTKERLQKAVAKALERFNVTAPAKKFIHLNADKEKALLYFNQIRYIKTAVAESRERSISG